MNKQTTAASKKTKGAAKTKKKIKRSILDAVAHVYASFNNTIITITDKQGLTLAWSQVAQMVLKVQEKVRLLLLKLQLIQLEKPLPIMV